VAEASNQDMSNQYYQGVAVKPSCIPAAVIFDMDGLLFDTEALYQAAILMAATEGGHDISSGIFGQTIGRTWEQTRAMLLDHFGAAFPVDEFITAWVRHFEVLSSDRQFLKPGVIELLDTLDDLRLPRLSPRPRHTTGCTTIWRLMTWPVASKRLSVTGITWQASPRPIHS
jgi:beta-phosphoglucomutase-like phosphatase (HAD superfamily)